MPSVNVPGVGRVNFPDTMSQQEIVLAIQRDILPTVQTKPEPGVLSQFAGLPKEIGKGFVRGLTVDPASGLASLLYTGARAAGAELTPFEKTSAGQILVIHHHHIK